MDFTCPHCGKTSPVVMTRKGSKSEKLKAAARRNGKLGGHRKASEADLLTVYCSRKGDWTWDSFAQAVKKSTGVEYSRASAFAILKKMKALVFKKHSLSADFESEGIQPERDASGKKSVQRRR